MPALIRYPLFGCVILVLSACGSSGSSTVLQPSTSSTSDPDQYSSVDYLIKDPQAAISKFGANAKALTQLKNERGNIVFLGTRYLSTGSIVATTEGNAVKNHYPAASCDDNLGGRAYCSLEADPLRDGVRFHLGATQDPTKDAGFLNFRADRQPVMDYRGVEMSQVRTTGTDKVASMQNGKHVYKDAGGNQYLLADANVTNKNLDDVDLSGVTPAPSFSDLTRVTVDSKYQYVGYDGILKHSMFFVGVHKFFDAGGKLEHTRYSNASLGQIYDKDTVEAGIQQPSVALTGTGAMVGVESKPATLEHHLVQGDVVINYESAKINVEIKDIKRLVGSGDAWYKSEQLKVGVLKWDDVAVTDSKFSVTGSLTTKGLLSGSFYGTKLSPEVGGVFRHQGTTYEIIGSFGSELTEPPAGGGS